MKRHGGINKKWLVILTIIALLITFDVLDEQKSISTRAIVLAISLDRGEEKSYKLGVQLLKSDKNNNQEYINFFQEGDSVSEIIETMNYDVGATVSLAHAMVIAVSREILTSDDDAALRYLMENQTVTYNTMLVASREKPEELLSAKLTNGIGSGYYLGQVLRTVKSDFGTMPVTIKDYFMLRYRIGACVHLPYVSVEKKDDNVYLGLTKTYVTDGIKETVLDEDATKGLSLVTGFLTNGSLTYRYEEITGEADIVQSTSDIKIDNDTANIILNLTMRDTSAVPSSIDENQCLGDISRTVENYILKCFEDCKAQGLDVFSLGQYCYAYGNSLVDEDDYLQKLNVKVTVKGDLK